MTTRAANEFRQRKTQYDEQEDGLEFRSWYHVDDLKRIVWKRFSQLDPNIKTETLQPFVFFDGLDQFTLESMLSPLVAKLKKSPQKYVPFIFKPELASAHYIAGFLRKKPDKTISIILFNPTGTLPRIDYGNYAYAFRLMKDEYDETESDFEIECNSVYFKINGNSLEYTLLNSEGEVLTHSFSQQDLYQLGIVLDFQIPLTTKTINQQLKPRAAAILAITLARGHTEKKIEIISSSRKIQTSEPHKDNGPLVSCGPLSLAFIEYLMIHPDYMKDLDKDFQLPGFLDLEADDGIKYKELVMQLRREHFQILDTIDDSVLNSGVIDDSYAELTQSILEPSTQYDDDSEVSECTEQNNSESWDDALANKKQGKVAYETGQKINSILKIALEHREDINFLRGQINRLRENAKSMFSINNELKAQKIERALEQALEHGVEDVRTDEDVRGALAFHRIFGFFGCKSTVAISKMEESIARSYDDKSSYSCSIA